MHTILFLTGHVKRVSTINKCITSISNSHLYTSLIFLALHLSTCTFSNFMLWWWTTDSLCECLLLLILEEVCSCVRMSLVYCRNTLYFLLLLLYVYPSASRWRIITYRISSVHQPHFSGSSAKSHHLEYVIFKTQQCEEKSRHIWSPKLWLPNFGF